MVVLGALGAFFLFFPPTLVENRVELEERNERRQREGGGLMLARHGGAVPPLKHITGMVIFDPVIPTARFDFAFPF